MAFNILIVDDSKAALFMFEKIIKLSGVPLKKLYTATNGQEALDVLSQSPLDLVITDINMPVMNGFELLENLKKQPKLKRLPVIFVTTEGRDEYITKAKDMGVENFIKKPFHPEDLKNVIFETLGVSENEESGDSNTGCDF